MEAITIWAITIEAITIEAITIWAITIQRKLDDILHIPAEFAVYSLLFIKTLVLFI